MIQNQDMKGKKMSEVRTRDDIMYEMRKNLQDGIHTMNACSCGRGKRGGTRACVCCLADELREVDGGQKSCSNCIEWLQKMHELNSDYTRQIILKDVEIKKLKQKIDSNKCRTCRWGTLVDGCKTGICYLCNEYDKYDNCSHHYASLNLLIDKLREAEREEE